MANFQTILRLTEYGWCGHVRKKYYLSKRVLQWWLTPSVTFELDESN